MRRALLLTGSLITLLAATPAMAQSCYCNFYGMDGACSDLVCYNDGSSDENLHGSSTSNGDVSVTITQNRSIAEPGDTITYTIRLRNNTNSSQRTDVLAELDDHMTFVSASDSGDEEDDEVEWDNIRVPSRSTDTLTLRVRIQSGADEGDLLRLRVETDDDNATITTRVDDDSDNDDDDDDDNDEDVTITLSDTPDPVMTGDILTYTLRLRNRSNDDISIDVRAELDNDTSFISASDDGDEEDDDVVEWDNIDIDEDETETLTLRVRVRSGVENGDTLRLTVEAEGEEETLTTRVGGGNNSGDVCTYYNSYLRQNYLDYCDSRHEDSRR